MMSTSNTFSVMFWIYASRAKNNQTQVYARITVNSKRVNLSLAYKVDVTLWDAHKQRMEGTSAKAKAVNQYLDNAYAQLFRIFQDLKLSGKLITPELIKSKYIGDHEVGKSLKDILAYHSKKIEHTVVKGTIKNFKVTEGYIWRFLKQQKKTSDVYLQELNYEFLCDFETFLRNYYPKGHIREMSHNTVMKHIQRFRKIITLAYHLEWIDKDPFVRWKLTFEKREREILNKYELAQLENYDIPIQRLERVRDLFIFSCYTGISFGDIMSLTSDNICKGIDGEDWIVTKRQKTKVSVKMPLLDKAAELVQKYRQHPLSEISGTLFPQISNMKMNLYLKEVADVCELNKNLTFHMARHTFATTVTLSNGVPIETVSKLLGHTKITTTQIYARVLEDKISADMQHLKARLSEDDEEVIDFRSKQG